MYPAAIGLVYFDKEVTKDSKNRDWRPGNCWKYSGSHG